MNTFKFNFSNNENTCSKGPESDIEEEIQWFESCEIKPSKNQIKNIDLIVKHAKIFICKDIEIGHVLAGEVISKIDDSEIKKILSLPKNEHSDLVAGKYEGGLKIWECTSDVIHYFEENKSNICFKNKHVLDLGCGAGILGIYAFINKAQVTFQDYNKDVIENITIPNVLLNIEEGERDTEIEKCTFYSGDWKSFNTICQYKYDILITSETIYNECNYNKLISVFTDKLTEDGTLYVAAKTHYFGVGGGTRKFEQLLKNNGSFNMEVCWKSSGGIQREILKVTKKVR